MATYRPFTRIQDLPANAQGERTILEAHLDAAHGTIVDALEYLAQAVWSSGGVVVPGSVTNPEGATLRVQGRMGVSADARTALAVGDQAVDLSSVGAGVRCLIVIRAEGGAYAAHTFSDPTTGESVTHDLLSHWGRLAVLEGDAGDYPPLPADCVPVAHVTKSGVDAVTIDAVLNDPPAPRAAGVVPRGDTASRPAAPPAGAAQLYWDEDEGKLIAHDGTSWMNLDGTAL